MSKEWDLKTIETTEGFAEVYRSLCCRIDIIQDRIEAIEDAKTDKTDLRRFLRKRENELDSVLSDLIFNEITKKHNIKEIQSYSFCCRGRFVVLHMYKDEEAWLSNEQ